MFLLRNQFWKCFSRWWRSLYRNKSFKSTRRDNRVKMSRRAQQHQRRQQSVSNRYICHAQPVSCASQQTVGGSVERLRSITVYVAASSWRHSGHLSSTEMMTSPMTRFVCLFLLFGVFMATVFVSGKHVFNRNQSNSTFREVLLELPSTISRLLD